MTAGKGREIQRKSVRHPQSVWFGIRRIRHAKQEKRSISGAKAQRLKYVPHPSFVESNWFEATHHPITSHPMCHFNSFPTGQPLDTFRGWGCRHSLVKCVNVFIPGSGVDGNPWKSCYHRLMWSIQKPCGYDGRSSSTRKHSLLPDVLLTWFR